MFGKKNSDEEKPQRVSIFKKRSFRYGSVATGFTVGFIAILVLINVVVTALSNKFPISIDLTTNKNYQISSKTVTYLKKINQDITITILADQGAFEEDSTYGPTYKIIKQFPQRSNHIKLEFKNIEKNDPSYASRYPKESFSTGDVMVTCGNKYKKISNSDLFVTTTNSETGSTSITGNKAEQEIDQAIEYVTAQNLPTIVIATGNSEQDSSGLQSVLTKNNYQIESKNIDTEGIDSKADAIAIVAPKNDFTSSEISKLDSYLKNNGSYGKSLMVFFDPEQGSLPTLESYLSEWGIKVGSGAVYDATNNFGAYFDIVEGNLNSTYVGSLNSDNHADLKNSRPLSLLFADSKGGITTASVAATKDTAKLWNPTVIDNSTAASFKPSNSDKGGPFNVMAIATKTESVNNKSVKSNVLVSGSYQMISSSLLQVPNLTNEDIILNTTNSMIGVKSSLNISSKDTTSQTLTITAAQAKVIEVIFIFLIPIAVIVAGFIVWLRRRHQ